VEELDSLREEHPFFWSPMDPGFWVFTRASTIREAYQRPELFSSSCTTVFDQNPIFRWVPQMLDPPEHTEWRQRLAPWFSPAAVKQREPRIRELCRSLVDEVVADGSCDFLTRFARPFPATIFMEVMGLPQEDSPQFEVWAHSLLNTPAVEDPDHSKAISTMAEVMEYFEELVGKREVDPHEDLVSDALRWQIRGEPIDREELLSLCLLMFMAGLDTVTTQLGYTWWHLAQHPDHRRRIISEPTIIPAAVEEFLRVYSFVPPARRVMEDVDFHGCPMKAGEVVWMPLSLATRDPAELSCPAEVDFDRENLPTSMAFGTGPHRCLGAHLARTEVRIALEEWHARIPDYRLVPGAEIEEHNAGMFGIKSLHIGW
jgi:cytochrome P450